MFENHQTIATGTLNILEAVKTYADDVVRGILLLVNQEEIYEANISIGVGHSIEEWMEACFALLNLNYKNYLIVNNNFKGSYKKLVSDNFVIQKLGYKSEVFFAMLAKLIIIS